MIERFMLNPPKRRKKAKRSVTKFLGTGLRLKGYKRRHKRTRRFGLPSLRKSFRRNAEGEWGAPIVDVITGVSGRGSRSAGPAVEMEDIVGRPTYEGFRKLMRKGRRGRIPGLKGFGKTRISGTRKSSRKASRKAYRKSSRKAVKRVRKTAPRRVRKGTKTMAKKRRGWKGSSRAHRIAYWIGRARRSRKTGRGVRSFLKKHKISLKKMYGYRRRHRASGKGKSRYIGKFRGMRIAANKRRSRRRYRRNPGMAWNKLVKKYGVMGAAKRRGRRVRRSYRRNRELYQIAPVAANRPRRRRAKRYASNRPLYAIPAGFAANPMTAALAFPKAILNVGFITKNVLPMAAGAIGSGLVGGLVTKYLLKGPQWTNAPWKKAALTAGGGILGGLAIGMATKGRKADWAYKFAAGGMLMATVQLFDAYLKKSLGLSGMGIGEISSFGSDDLKRRIAEELKTELDGVSGFVTQEDIDATGVSSIGTNAVSGFVTSEDLPSEGNSVSIDEFSAAPVM